MPRPAADPISCGARTRAPAARPPGCRAQQQRAQQQQQQLSGWIPPHAPCTAIIDRTLALCAFCAPASLPGPKTHKAAKPRTSGPPGCGPYFRRQTHTSQIPQDPIPLPANEACPPYAAARSYPPHRCVRLWQLPPAVCGSRDPCTGLAGCASFVTPSCVWFQQCVTFPLSLALRLAQCLLKIAVFAHARRGRLHVDLMQPV